VLGSYGASAERPHIFTRSGSGLIYASSGDLPIGNIAVVGLRIDGAENPWYNSPTAIAFLKGTNVLLEDNRIERFGGALNFQRYSGDLQNIHLYRNVIANNFSRSGSHAQGFFSLQVQDFLVEENIFNKNGCTTEVAQARLTNASWDPTTRILSQAGAFGPGTSYSVWTAGDQLKITGGLIASGSISSFVNQGGEFSQIVGSSGFSGTPERYRNRLLRVQRNDGSWTESLRISSYDATTRSFTMARSFRVTESNGTFIAPGNAIEVHAGGVYEVQGILNSDAIRLVTSELWDTPLTGVEATSGADGRCTIFNRHAYISGGDGSRDGTVVAGNITRRGSSGFAQMRMGGAALGNVSMSEPSTISIGHDQNAVDSVYTGVMRGNLALGAQDINFDRPLGWGLSVGGGRQIIRDQNGVATGLNCLSRSENVLIEDNILKGPATSTTNLEAIALGACSFGHVIQNNVVYDWITPIGSGQVTGTALSRYGWQNRVDSILIANNDFQQPSGRSTVYFSFPASELAPGSLFMQGNRYFSAESNQRPILAFGRDLRVTEWSAAPEWGMVPPTDETFTQVAYPDPNRTVSTYLQSIGLPGSEEELWTRLMTQSRATWDPRLQSHRINNHIRAGFGKAPLPTARQMVEAVRSE
jgi:hypothetical protein